MHWILTRAIKSGWRISMNFYLKRCMRCATVKNWLDFGGELRSSRHVKVKVTMVQVTAALVEYCAVCDCSCKIFITDVYIYCTQLGLYTPVCVVWENVGATIFIWSQNTIPLQLSLYENYFGSLGAMYVHGRSQCHLRACVILSHSPKTLMFFFLQNTLCYIHCWPA